MADNFDLKKFLKESKALENLNPVIAKGNLSEGGMREKIREYILDELAENSPSDYDYEEEDIYGDYDDDEAGYFSHVSDLEDSPMEDELDEAKKKSKEEDVEDVEDVEVTDTETEDIPAEDTPAVDGGIEDIAANMEGTENDLMKHLMDALSIAKGMNNEKLETQIGNTLKFFVSEYIGGGEQ